MIRGREKEGTMTLNELIKDIDMHLPGNRFDNNAKTMWINEVEGKIFEEIESRTLSKQGSDINFARRNGAGEWVTDVKTINKLHDSEEDADNDTEAETDSDTSASDTESKTVSDNSYACEMDPLNLMGCCGCIDTDSQVRYELIPYKYPQDKDIRLICPDRFADVYVHYVLAKMHAADSEINEYNNEVLLFDASYKDYAAWHIRNFRR